MKRERKQYTGEEKVAILRKHLLEGGGPSVSVGSDTLSVGCVQTFEPTIVREYVGRITR